MLRCLLPLLLSFPMQSAPASRPATEAPMAGLVYPISALNQLPKPKAGDVRVLLVRHGQSIGNSSKDDPALTEAQKDRLSDRGKAEAAEAGAALRTIGVVKILHSPKVRARESAEIVRSEIGRE